MAIIFCTALGLGVLLGALGLGSVAIPPDVVWQTLTGGGDELAAVVVLRLRLPRALSALATGGSLALAGTLLQVVVRNPLAEPYLLGVAGGAAVAALAALSAGWAEITTAAALGAFCSTLIVLGLAGRTMQPVRLALTGVAVAASWGALVSLLLIISPEGNLRGILFWLMGDLGQAQAPYRSLLILIFGVIVALIVAPRLNLLARGELTAAALGITAQPLRMTLYLLSSLLTASAVTEAGTIGFIGLIAPHLARRLFGADHRLIIPAATLCGAILLLLADTGARTFIAPRELPVGVITALIGAPVFLILIRRGVPG